MKTMRQSQRSAHQIYKLLGPRMLAIDKRESQVRSAPTNSSPRR